MLKLKLKFFSKNLLFLFTIVQIVPLIFSDTKQLYEIHLFEPSGIARHEVTWLENADTPEEHLVVKGNTTNFILKHGNKFFFEETEYIADQNGYRAKFKIYAQPSNEDRLGAIALKSTVGG